MILADVDTNAANHTLPVTDPVGPFGQTGAYTDEESKGNGTSSGLALLGQGRYFDPKSLRYINRFASIENEYQAKILPWAVTSSILRGVSNAYFEGLAAVPNLGSDAISFLTLKKVSLGHVPESWSHPVKSGTDKYSRAFEKYGEIGLAFGGTLSLGTEISKAQTVRDAIKVKPGIYVYFPATENLTPHKRVTWK